MVGFPPRAKRVFYLTEGGQETEILYRHGHDLPEFAMFPLFENPLAMADLGTMYRRVLDAAADHGFVAMLSGLDYRASPDWGAKLGYSQAALGEAIARSIGFLRDVSAGYAGQLPGVLLGGVIGPRGDAYVADQAITADEAEEYHSFQLATLKRAGADFAGAVTFNNIPEAVGIARAAARIGIPLGVSFTLDSNNRLASGPGLDEAIIAVDAAAGAARPDFYGINCSHPLEFEPALGSGTWMERLRMLRPNASDRDKMELCAIGHIEDGDPADLGRRMGAVAARYPNFDIFGGCCGTWAPHLDAIAANVRAVRG